jgi:2,4-dienoyl-CoA reductase-like NADH-dependent reductase (Old Yellow Enzyme family)
MSVRFRIENFLRRTRMSATEFGRLAIGDPRLVHDLRNGRELRPPTVARVEAFLARQESAR